MGRKLLNFLLVSLLATSILFTFSACNSHESEVKLLSITGTTNYDKSYAAAVFASAEAPSKRILRADTSTETDTSTEGTDSNEKTSEETETTDTEEDGTVDLSGETTIDPSLVSGYSIIYKSQTRFYLTITLDNPNNYYIMDFRLSCPGSEIYILQGTTYSNINAEDTYVRWDEAYDRVGNKVATFELKLESPEVSPDKIKIEELYYSSRQSGANKNYVNTDGKETYTIYKIDGPMEMYDRTNTFTEFNFKLNTNGVSIISVVADDTEVLTADADGIYHLTHDGKLDITYEYAVGDDQLPARITSTENIELLKFVATSRSVKDNSILRYALGTPNVITLYGYFTGTDADTITLYDGENAIVVNNDRSGWWQQFYPQGKSWDENGMFSFEPERVHGNAYIAAAITRFKTWYPTAEIKVANYRFNLSSVLSTSGLPVYCIGTTI